MLIWPFLRAPGMLPSMTSWIQLCQPVSLVTPRVRLISPALRRLGSILLMYLPSEVLCLSSMESASSFSPSTCWISLISMPSISRPNDQPTPVSNSGSPTLVAPLLHVHGLLARLQPLVHLRRRAAVGALRAPTCHSETRLVPPENCESRKTTNSAGLTGATPISQTTWPASMPSAGFVSSSHFTKNASFGVEPNRAPLRHSFTRNAAIVRRIFAHSARSFGSNTTQSVPPRIDSSR